MWLLIPDYIFAPFPIEHLQGGGGQGSSITTTTFYLNRDPSTPQASPFFSFSSPSTITTTITILIYLTLLAYLVNETTTNFTTTLAQRERVGTFRLKNEILSECGTQENDGK